MEYKIDGAAMRAARFAIRMKQSDLAIRLRELQIGFGFSAARISNMETGRDQRPVTEWQAMCIGVALRQPLSALCARELAVA